MGSLRPHRVLPDDRSGVKAEEISAGRLFGSDQQLLIPLWQRHYSWEQPQWAELWSDLLRVQEEGPASHFLGSVVLNALPWAGLPSEARRFWVVDGQQRVTTLTLLVCAIRDRLAQLSDSEEQRAEVQRSYTSQLLQNLNLQTTHRDRLVLQEKDAALLGPIVNGTWNGGTSSLIEKGYAYFRSQLHDAGNERLVELLSIVLVKMTAVWVTLEDGDNAHRVFQTLNAGGKKLNQSDLVRNYFFLLLGQLGNDFYSAHWRHLEGDFSSRELEEFLVAWTVSQGYTGGKDSLFSYFHKDLMQHESEPGAVLAYGMLMADAARLFRWIRQPGDATLGPATQRALVDLRKWSTLPAEGLLLWLLRRNQQGKLAAKHLAQALESVLSFMARRQVAGFQPNLHKPIFVATTRKLRSADHLVDKDTADYLRYLLSQGEDVRTWPSDETIKAVARTTPIYSTSRSAWTFSILERVNREMFENEKHAPPSLDRSKYSVEHVMPQKLTGRWVDDLLGWGVNNPNQLHESHLHVLGNLTLTPINSELSNLPFDAKREQLSDDWLRLNSEIASASTWTEHRINERSTVLAQKVCQAYLSPFTQAELSAAQARFAVPSSSEGSEVEEIEAALQEEGG